MFNVEEPMLHLFLACQGFVVLFIALHDWIPLGSLNNLSRIRAADSTPKLLVVTVLSTLPFAVAFAASPQTSVVMCGIVSCVPFALGAWSDR
jgi:hypothetical protein